MSILAADLKHAGQSLRMLSAYCKIDDAKDQKNAPATAMHSHNFFLGQQSTSGQCVESWR